MNDVVKNEREIRKKKRLRKKRQSTVITLMMIVILMTVGVVNAQTQGYEVFYHGKSLGYVQTASVFQSAVNRLQNSLVETYDNDNIRLGDGFDLVPARVENPMDFDACVTVLSNAGIELYVKGTTIIVNGQEIGTMASADEAQRLITTCQGMTGNDGQNSGIHSIQKTVPLSGTKDFATMYKTIKALKN